jgi:heptosyltransferase-2
MPALIFGSESERELCQQVAGALAQAGIDARNLAGQTTLREFIDLAAACRVFLTNDSGAMHVASALGVPSVTVFGATDDTTTGPTGPLARVVREHAECSPCLLRECPIDHRCMTRVSSERVAATALELIAETAWTREARS